MRKQPHRRRPRQQQRDAPMYRAARDWRHWTLWSLCLMPAVEAATGFPGTLPSTHSSSKPAGGPTAEDVVQTGASSDDDDEYLLESSSDEYDEDDILLQGQTHPEPVMSGKDSNLLPQGDDEEENENEEIQGDEDEDVDAEETKEANSELQQSDPEESESSPSSMLPESVASTSQPLRTLKKLQAMLDDTDYMTTSHYRADVDSPVPPVIATSFPTPFIETETWSDRGDAMMEMDHDEPAAVVDGPEESLSPTTSTGAGPDASQPPRTLPQEQDKLWTSKDRSKYKKQQFRLRQREEQRRRQQLQSPPIHPSASDDDMTDGETDGDGLGYTLPNFPVYNSDDEGTTTDGLDMEPARFPPPPAVQTFPQAASGQQQQQQQQQQAYNQYPPPPYPYTHGPDQSAAPGQPGTSYTGYPPSSYPMPYPYGSYTPQQQQQLYASQQQAAAWAGPYAPTAPLYPPWSSRTYRQYQVPPVGRRQIPLPRDETSPPPKAETSVGENSFPHAAVASIPTDLQTTTASYVDSSTVTLAEATANLTFDAVQKLSILVVGVVLLAYCAVSPRTLALVDYNERFKANLAIVSLVIIAPIVNFLLVVDTRENDVNALVNTFYTSFTVGYSLAFILEILLTTVLRLGVFALWDPDVFALTPKVPLLVLPWVLREKQYRPKRITLFAADFVTSCVAAPIVEEYVKLKILQLSVSLPKNFNWNRKKSGKKSSRKKRRVAEVITRGPGEREVSNINRYVTQMLMASLGMKLCDTVRRIFMYTKESQPNKGFYAFCRGLFPIHELCGTMTALALAKRDVLGVDVPLWQILHYPVILHGMANFRGMKPIFKWNSATPWSEMQLSPWNVADDSTLRELVSKGFAKLMWLILLGRVLGYCIKNYYMIRRHALKRTTTYAGKHASFSGELVADEMLKKSKDKK